MDKQRISKVWLAVTKEPRASIAKLADKTGLPETAVHGALVILREQGHVLPAPAIGAPRRIVLGIHEGKPARGAVQVQGARYPIVGEVRGGYRDEPVVRLYENDAAA